MRDIILLLTTIVILGCADSSPPPIDMEHLNSPESESLDLPFSEAVRVGNTLYLSGQLGHIPGTMDLVPGGVGPETEQTLKNIKATLERHGSSLDKVVKCTVFMADIKEWPAMNEVYRRFFGPKYPARSAVGGGELALGARLEIECIALVDSQVPEGESL